MQPAGEELLFLSLTLPCRLTVNARCAIQGYLPPTKNGVEPKRPSRPINITSLVRLSTTVPNTIVVSWTSEIGRVRTRDAIVRDSDLSYVRFEISVLASSS